MAITVIGKQNGVAILLPNGEYYFADPDGDLVAENGSITGYINIKNSLTNKYLAKELYYTSVLDSDGNVIGTSGSNCVSLLNSDYLNRTTKIQEFDNVNFQNTQTAGQVLMLTNQSGSLKVDNVSLSTSAVTSLNGLSGALTLASGNDNATIDASGSTITLEVQPQYIYEIVKNVSGGALSKGTPVKVTGASGNTPEVIAADAATNYPAHFILFEDISNGSEGGAIAFGHINQVSVPDASIYSEGDEVFLGASGGWTTTKPTGTNQIQKLGVILKVDTVSDTVGGIVQGAGRVNDVPNIPQGYIWAGNSSGVATPTDTAYIDISNSRVGIGTTSPAYPLDVDGNIRATAYRIGGGTILSGSSDVVLGSAGATSTVSINTTGGTGLTVDSSAQVGIGTTSPISPLHVYQNDTDTGTGSGITIEQDGTGDAVIQFLATNSRRWVAGIDNSDGDRFKIASSSDVGTDDHFEMDGDGVATFNGDQLQTSSDTDVTYGAITATQNGSIVRGGFMNPASEANMVHLPHIVNDLAGFQHWGTITTSGLYKTRSGTSGSYTYSNEVAASDFDNGAAFDGYSSHAGSWYSDNGVDGSTITPGVITLEWSDELRYSAWVGIVFGANGFTATEVKIEAYRGGAWQTLCDLTGNTDQVVMRQIGSNSGAGNATTKVRYTLGGSVNNSYFRIHTLYAANYRAGDNNLSGTFTDKTRGVHYLEKYKNNYAHGHFYPADTNTYNLGSTSLQWNTIYSNGGNSSQWNTAYGWGNHASAGYISNLVEDTTPQLGGTLDANGNTIDMGTNVITDTKVGHWDTAYGWGDHSTQGYFAKGSDIPSGADLNTYTTDGYYHQNSNANAAAGSNYPEDKAGMLVVYSDGVMVYQRYLIYDSTTDRYERGYYNGTWNSWKKLWHDSDFSSTDISNWDTAYGWGNHASAGYLTGITGQSIKNLSDVYSSMAPTDGQVLTYDTTNGWQAETPSSGITASGTPVVYQIAVFNTSSSVEGDSNLTWTGTQFTIGGGAILSADLIKMNGRAPTSPSAGEVGAGGNVITQFHTSGSVTAGGVYVAGSSAWVQADADAGSTATGLLAVATDAASPSEMLIEGSVKLASNTGFSTASKGDVLYLSLTAGELTSDISGHTTGDFVRVCGYVIDASKNYVYFKPDNTWLEL